MSTGLNKCAFVPLFSQEHKSATGGAFATLQMRLSPWLWVLLNNKPDEIIQQPSALFVAAARKENTNTKMNVCGGDHDDDDGEWQPSTRTTTTQTTTTTNKARELCHALYVLNDFVATALV